MWWIPRGTDARRRGLLKRASSGPMADFYRTPWPERSTPLEELEFIALDLETTGLSARRHEIVSIGWVLIRDMRVQYGERGHMLSRPEKPLTEESAVIHTLTDDTLADAPPLGEALDALLPVLAGRVLIAHYIHVERRFLQRACRSCHGLPFEMPMIDTLELEKRSFDRRGKAVLKGMLRLDAVRERYNLPRYRAHNAMLDAIAAGELFLAQAAHKAGAKGKLVLGDVAL